MYSVAHLVLGLVVLLLLLVLLGGVLHARTHTHTRVSQLAHTARGSDLPRLQRLHACPRCENTVSGSAGDCWVFPFVTGAPSSWSPHLVVILGVLVLVLGVLWGAEADRTERPADG